MPQRLQVKQEPEKKVDRQAFLELLERPPKGIEEPIAAPEQIQDAVEKADEEMVEAQPDQSNGEN